MNYFKIIAVLFGSLLIYGHVFSKHTGEQERKTNSNDQKSNNQDDNTYKSSGNTIAALHRMKIPEQLRLPDNIIGNEQAPITLIIYSSYTCVHCKKFLEKEFPKFKKLHVDNGQVKVIFRQYIMDPGAFEAALLEVCLDKKYGTGDWELARRLKPYIFSYQDKWFKSRNPAKFLRDIVSKYPELKAHNIRAYINNCLDESGELCMNLGAGLMLNQQDANNWGIKSVPAFIVLRDGKKITMHNGSMSAPMLWILCQGKGKTQTQKFNPQRKS